MINATPWGQTPSKYMAIRTVSKAVKAGTLKRPKKCPLCGSKPGVDRQGNKKIKAVHTKGYAYEYRLDIEWMCVSCKSKWVWQKRKEANK